MRKRTVGSDDVHSSEDATLDPATPVSGQFLQEH